MLRKGSDLATVPGAQRLQGSTGCPGFSTVTILEWWLVGLCVNTNGDGGWGRGQQLPGGEGGTDL